MQDVFLSMFNMLFFWGGVPTWTMLRQVGQFGSHRRAIWWTCPGNPEKLLVSRLTLGKDALPPLGKTWKRKPNLWCFLDGCYSKDAGYCTFRQRSVFFGWSQNILEQKSVEEYTFQCVSSYLILLFSHTSAPKLETVGCLIDCLPLHQAQSAELNVELIYIWQIPVIRFHDTFVVASEDATKLIEVIDLPLTQVHVFWSLELLVQLQFNFQSWNLRIWQVPRFLDSLTSGHWALGILGSQVWLPTSRVVRGRNYQERGYGCQLSAQLR